MFFVVLVFLCVAQCAHVDCTHIFKESSPHLLSRNDVVKRNRLESDYVHVVIFSIRQRNMDELTRILHDVSDPLSTNYGQHLTKKEVTDMTSNPESRDAVVSYLHSNGASVISETLDGDYITAQAPIIVWEKILDTEFFTFHQTDQNNRVSELVRAEKYSIPRVLHSHVEGVFKTIEMPVVTYGSLPKLSSTPKRKLKNKWATSSYPYDGTTTPPSIRAFYNMSSSVSGSASSTQCVFASNSQYYSPADLAAFQGTYGIPLQPVTTNVGGHSSDSVCISTGDSCGEGNLDLQYLMGMSPGSPTTFWYTDFGFSNFLVDVANLANPPLILSVSYGSLEQYNAAADLLAFTAQAIKLGVMGVTIVVSSGDDGANSYLARHDAAQCGYQPQFPATCPYVIAVGATSGAENGGPEIVCSTSTGGISITSGGGFSNFFIRPSYQSSAVTGYFAAAAAALQSPVVGYNTSGRGYPDVSLGGSFYMTYVGGSSSPFSGTSASAPALAGFLSNINAARMAVGKGSLGWFNPTLYANFSSFTNDITVGHNLCVLLGLCCTQGFYAAPGWDPATGLGTLNYGNMQALMVSLGNVNGAFRAPSFTPTPAPTNKPSNAPTPLPTKKPTFSPSLVPTKSPTVGPSRTPTNTPSFAPTKAPTSVPTRTPTASPTTRTPTSTPTIKPTGPSPAPSLAPTLSPTSQPTANPTGAPISPSTSQPTASPTGAPTSSPISSVTSSPTAEPTEPPSSNPTSSPTSPPTAGPTIEPTYSPTSTPTMPPTAKPSAEPTYEPTSSPTSSPTGPTLAPTFAPSSSPTFQPSVRPTATPTDAPTTSPTISPSSQPSATPTTAPTSSPTSTPSSPPTGTPSTAPTSSPTSTPTLQPSATPTTLPTSSPTSTPSSPPTGTPSTAPTSSPTSTPSSPPTGTPSTAPTSSPTSTPTSPPTGTPSTAPTSSPTSTPSSPPTGTPSTAPTSSPTSTPSSPPTGTPSTAPTSSPTSTPSSPPTGTPSTAPTSSPTSTPSSPPTGTPSTAPTSSPTSTPSSPPTGTPSTAPTSSPTSTPSSPPTGTPSTAPTSSPTSTPSTPPTGTPSTAPTSSPTSTPSSPPTGTPSTAPTSSPTSTPTSPPTGTPSTAPTSSPTSTPTSPPTGTPSTAPTSSPTSTPSSPPTGTPSTAPTSSPTSTPTSPPTGTPSTAPTSSPTSTPTSLPTANPTIVPTGTPTVSPALTATNLPGSPSMAPTAAIVTVLAASQTLSGITLTEASSESFLTAFTDTVATVLGQPGSSITGVHATQSGRRLLSSVTILYIVTVTSSSVTPAALITTLQSSVNSGSFLTALSTNSGLAITSLAPILLTNLSPTSSPTLSPTSSAITILSSALTTSTVVGIAVGGGGGFLVVGLGIGAYWFRLKATTKTSIVANSM